MGPGESVALVAPGPKMGHCTKKGKTAKQSFHGKDLHNGLMNGDQFGSVREGGFYLDVGDHVGDTVHDIVA